VENTVLIPVTVCYDGPLRPSWDRRCKVLAQSLKGHRYPSPRDDGSYDDPGSLPEIPIEPHDNTILYFLPKGRVGNFVGRLPRPHDDMPVTLHVGKYGPPLTWRKWDGGTLIAANVENRSSVLKAWIECHACGYTGPSPNGVPTGGDAFLRPACPSCERPLF